MQPNDDEIIRHPQEWPIRKILTPSDVGQLSRLALPQAKVQESIFRFWDEGMIGMLNRGHQRRVIIRDVDTGVSIRMVFRRWRYNKMYVFQLNWIKEFVRRRGLQEGDEIGIAWDQPHQCFLFSVLNHRGLSDESLQLRLTLSLLQPDHRILRPNPIRLVRPWQEWPIRKNLTASDVGCLSKLVLPRPQVHESIFPFWDGNLTKMVDHGDLCVNVVIRDVDTHGSTHSMVFERWMNNEAYVIQSNWAKEFVERRGLHQGDEIGIAWDQTIQCFLFSVLSHKHLDLDLHI